MNDPKKLIQEEKISCFSSMVKSMSKLSDVHYYLALNCILEERVNDTDRIIIKNSLQFLEYFRDLYVKEVELSRKAIIQLDKLPQQLTDEYIKMERIAQDTGASMEMLEEMDINMLRNELDQKNEDVIKTKRNLEKGELVFYQRLLVYGYSESLAKKISLRPELHVMHITENLRKKYQLSNEVPWTYENKPGVFT